VSDETSGAAAEALAARARQAVAKGAVTDAAVGEWSRSETRGLSSRKGGLLDAVRAAIRASLPQPAPPPPAAGGEEERQAPPMTPPTLFLLSATGTFIGDACADMLAAARANPADRAAGAVPAGVVVLLGDDRGLTAKEEAEIHAAAEELGCNVRSVSLGNDMLLASHAIVLVHHYLDRNLHSCQLPPSRNYSRGGGQNARAGHGGGGRGRGKGKGKGAGGAMGKGKGKGKGK
jgi:hypothetical protein